ncbi:MAG: sterol desaturase family protein [Deltaproteobacteria bacterium]|nr:sterol desaturase family protein [Deltaproteobacteria bacterium]
MTYDYKVLAGPVFFLLIGMEAWLSRRRGWGYYRLNDAVSDVSTSMLMQLVMLLSRGAVVAGYFVIHAHFRIVDLPADRAWTWIACFLGVDFGYYWFHRSSHEINFLWAAHVVHHQSEDYNLAVALRQSTLQPFFGAVFYWPLALLGFPPVVFLACASFNTIYQFWLHTQAIGTLGPLEAVLVTPSHHRVHHARNPRYIDRNHGGTFIVWDRLFGTFEREREAVVYGITKPLASWNPLWANLHYWAELCRTARRTPHPLDKLRTFLKPPGWFPADQGGFRPPPPVPDAPVKFDCPYAPALGRYALVQFVLLVGATVVLSFCAGMYELGAGLAAIGVVGWGFVNLGGLFDGRAWARRSEAVRVVTAPAVALLVLSGAVAWASAVVLFLGVPFFFLVSRAGSRGAPAPEWGIEAVSGRSR